MEIYMITDDKESFNRSASGFLEKENADQYKTPIKPRGKAVFSEAKPAMVERRMNSQRKISDRRESIRFEQDRRKMKDRRKNEYIWNNVN